MGKATQVGASVAVPASVVRNVLERHAAGDALSSIRYWLNASAVPFPDHNGVPRAGLWNDRAVQELIDQHTTEETPA